MDPSITTMPMSLLDTDLYKISMQQAVLRHFPNVDATYKFQNRNPDCKWSRPSVDRLRTVLDAFKFISLKSKERKFLERACPYLTRDYLEYLEGYRYKPEEVDVNFIPSETGSDVGDLNISINGPWHSTILWEVPLMAAISESYFTTFDTDWSMEGQEEQAFEKGRTLLRAGCKFSEFGTRRRRSFETQDVVIAGLVRAAENLSGESISGALSGTSNVYLAMKYGLKPIGTIAHEWFMGIGAMKGYEVANILSLELWEQTYPKPGVLRTALTDTFSTEVFFKDMLAHPEFLEKFPSLRQDSGDPFTFAPRAKEVYQEAGMTYHDKTIVYSDNLNVEKCVGLQKQCTDDVGMQAAYGIGTNLTNDFMKRSTPEMKSKVLNIVIKLASVDGKGCVKISDDLTKNTGLIEDVNYVKDFYTIPR